MKEWSRGDKELFWISLRRLILPLVCLCLRDTEYWRWCFLFVFATLHWWVEWICGSDVGRIGSRLRGPSKKFKILKLRGWTRKDGRVTEGYQSSNFGKLSHPYLCTRVLHTQTTDDGRTVEGGRSPAGHTYVKHRQNCYGNGFEFYWHLHVANSRPWILFLCRLGRAGFQTSMAWRLDIRKT